MSIATRIDKLERETGNGKGKIVVCWLCDATPSEAEERIAAARGQAGRCGTVLKVVWEPEKNVTQEVTRR